MQLFWIILGIPILAGYALAVVLTWVLSLVLRLCGMAGADTPK